MSSQNADSLRVAYDHQASGRDRSGIEDWKAQERDRFLAILQQRGTHTLLEIGSGPGRDGDFFQKAGLRVTCIDLSLEMIRLCREKNLNALVMDVTDLAFPDSSFDSVYSLNSLLHLTKSELGPVLKSINRVLTPNGIFFMGVYGGREFEGIREDDRNEPKRFFSFFTDDQLRRVVSVVFNISSFRIVPVPRDDSLHFQSLILTKRSAD